MSRAADTAITAGVLLVWASLSGLLGWNELLAGYVAGCWVTLRVTRKRVQSPTTTEEAA